MDRNLIDYLPPVLRAVLEFMEITDAQQPEFERAWDALKLVTDNQFIDTATEEGVTVWEKELGITPFNTDTLEQRKQRIQTAWTYGVVYTYNWLVNWLKSSCGDNISLPVIKDYVIRAAIPISADYIGIVENMRRYISANIIINPVLLLSKMEMTHYIGVAFRTATRGIIQTSAWNTDNIVILVDENNSVLLDENNEVLYEEANT